MAGWWRAGIGCLMIVAAVVLLLKMPITRGNGTQAAPPPANQTASPAPVATPTPATLTVRYYIEGTPNDFHARISYVTPSNDVSQVPDYQGPWDNVRTFTTGQLVQITAEELAPGSDNQSITCEIQINGQTWRHQMKQGKDATVTCQGVLGGP